MICFYGFCDDFIGFEVCSVLLFGGYVVFSGVLWRKYLLAQGSKCLSPLSGFSFQVLAGSLWSQRIANAL